MPQQPDTTQIGSLHYPSIWNYWSMLKPGKKLLIDKLYRLGLSISSDRVMQISADLGNSVCAQFEAVGVVCSLKLKTSRALFTTGSVDNIDHNPNSRTAENSFHRTAISLTEHPTNDFKSVDRNRVLINADLSKRKTVSNLPEAYTSIQPYIETESRKDYLPLFEEIAHSI